MGKKANRSTKSKRPNVSRHQFKKVNQLIKNNPPRAMGATDQPLATVTLAKDVDQSPQPNQSTNQPPNQSTNQMTPIEQLPLTPKQQRFCDEYFTDRNAAAAAIRAGYSAATAANGQLMQVPKIAAYIAKRTENERDTLHECYVNLVDELGKIAFASMGDYFDDDGNMKPIHKLSDDEKAAIWSISVTEKKDGTKTTHIRLNNKLAAMEKIAKYIGLYKMKMAPEVKYVYLNKSEMDEWDSLDDDTMPQPKPQKQQQQPAPGVIQMVKPIIPPDEAYEYYESWQEELDKREALLDKREEKLQQYELNPKLKQQELNDKLIRNDIYVADASKTYAKPIGPKTMKEISLAEIPFGRANTLKMSSRLRH